MKLKTKREKQIWSEAYAEAHASADRISEANIAELQKQIEQAKSARLCQSQDSHIKLINAIGQSMDAFARVLEHTYRN